MSAITDLLQQVPDKALRDRLEQEVARLSKRKKFGLVFEEHIPECTPLYDVKIRIGSTVALKTGKINNFYTVIKITGTTVTCFQKSAKTTTSFELSELVTIAQFGEPIYPTLKPIDVVENAPDSSLWHILIEADNYHALQLLEYLYPKKVDCIYIDPPYNSGAKDWKYNNNYVDSTDAYRHSKWLSMMEKRLKIARRILNPKDSVLICTIDEKEYLHLGCMLEELFPEARIQMISDVINPKGVARNGFSRNDEYIFFVMLGDAMPARLALGDEWSTSATIANTETDDDNNRLHDSPNWTSMMRRGSNSSRVHSPGCYYPIYADPSTKVIKVIGEPIPRGKHSAQEIAGLTQILPIRTNGDEGCWQVSPQELKIRKEQGRIRLGRKTRYGFVVNYLPDGAYAEVLSEMWIIDGKADDGSLIAHYNDKIDSTNLRVAPTQWKISTHNASEKGSSLISKILCGKRFTYPKSLYSEYDAIRFFTIEKPNALIIDFFAGSGTTLHAVNLINAEDNGNRHCIMVTNNEVSDDEAKTLRKKGYKPGDEEWEKLGIARYVTWPRTVCSIEGHNVNGDPLEGIYEGTDLAMSKGFDANVEYFKLGFLDKNKVAMGKQFKEILPILWLKAGAIGKRPELKSSKIPDMLVLPENKLAVLTKESSFMQFEDELRNYPEIESVFIVTDSERAYKEMISGLNVKNSYQLYRDYLDNFRINARR